MASRKRSISNDADVSALYYKEWDEASCPICMDHPHNAVLLICSSHDKGCRSYICDTSYRHSNCLDRFKQLKEENNSDSFIESSLIPAHGHRDSLNTSSANLDLTTSSYYISGNRRGRDSSGGGSNGSSSQEREGSTQEALSYVETTNMENPEKGLNLICPLCRGTVLGWKVVEEARKYLNLKSRTCSHESCSFSGNYGELRRHARRIHPTIRPADVDPSRQRDWRHFENRREYDDVISAIHSAMPGAIVVGDYVIENEDRVTAGERNRSGDRGQFLSTLFLFHRIGSTDRRRVELRNGRSRMFSRNRRARGNLSRRRSLWGENLLGFQENDRRDYEDDRLDRDAMPNDLEDGGDPNPRRRRRLSHARSNENQQ